MGFDAVRSEQVLKGVGWDVARAVAVLAGESVGGPGETKESSSSVRSWFVFV